MVGYVGGYQHVVSVLMGIMSQNRKQLTMAVTPRRDRELGMPFKFRFTSERLIELFTAESRDCSKTGYDSWPDFHLLPM